MASRGERYRDLDREDEFRASDSSRRPRSNKNIDEPPPALFSIHRGEVRSIQEYGVFVKLDGYERHGLVHISQISSSRLGGKADIEQMLAINDSCFCKIIGLEDGKISLSMKYVGQTEGNDLDKNNVKLELDMSRKRTFRDEASRTVELGAVLNTTCSRCGGHGHTKLDCYSEAGQYDLVPDVEAAEPALSRDQVKPRVSEPPASKKHKKEKHGKKEKRHKKEKKKKNTKAR